MNNKANLDGEKSSNFSVISVLRNCLIFYCQQCILLSHASCPVCASPAQWSDVADHANISHCQEEMQQNNLSAGLNLTSKDFLIIPVTRQQQ